MKGKSKRTVPQAFTTGQAARYCFVTSETILNWIRSHRLEAQRTAGGQYRIRFEALLQFMTENGMDTTALDADSGVRPPCWEFHGRISDRFGSRPEGACSECLAYRSGALNCWELHGFLPVTGRRIDDCAQCPYAQEYRRPEKPENPIHQTARLPERNDHDR